jgi:hypothetical protein
MLDLLEAIEKYGIWAVALAIALFVFLRSSVDVSIKYPGFLKKNKED